jgi:hypothetical protein
VFDGELGGCDSCARGLQSMQVNGDVAEGFAVVPWWVRFVHNAVWLLHRWGDVGACSESAGGLREEGCDGVWAGTDAGCGCWCGVLVVLGFLRFDGGWGDEV